jgi:cytochrome c-type biogenesis protein CcmF
MIEFGTSSLLFALILSVMTMAGSLIAIRKNDWRFVEFASRGVYATTLFMTIAVGMLIYSFITNDFRIEYVVSYSEISLPIFYKITGLWAGQKGSLLFWGWLLAIYMTYIVIKDSRKPGAVYLPYVIVFMNLTVMFFLFLLNFITPPFELIALIPPDGNGLNPLLQNPGMVFHPPTLYLGYVGFTVPFAYALAAMATGDLGDWWIKKTRAWTLFSWMFLTLGIVFGGWWAYRELGWGGVWGWDPVENSSILPWFTATAFLHSVMIQERRGMLKVWNLSLIIMTFALSIFGTFITRSGIITSVHAFGQSVVGYVFLGFLIIVLILCFSLLALRYKTLRGKVPRVESLLSKESSFLYNNIILVGLCFATFWGTVFPLVSEAVKGVKISVGPPFFNTVNAPLFLLLIVLMALCPLLGWRSSSVKSLLKNLTVPAVAMALFIPVLIYLGVKMFFPLFFFAFSLFVLIAVSREFYQGVRVSLNNAKDEVGTAIFKHLKSSGRRYGGFLVQVGIIMIVTGLVGYGYYQFKEDYSLTPGQKIEIADYTLVYKGLKSREKPTYEGVFAEMEVYDSKSFLGILRPEKRYYKKATKKSEPTTEVAIMQKPKEDIYLILSGWENNGRASLTVIINPLLYWVWIGTGVIVFGIILCVLPRRRKDTEIDALVVDYLIHSKEAK